MIRQPPRPANVPKTAIWLELQTLWYDAATDAYYAAHGARIRKVSEIPAAELRALIDEEIQARRASCTELQQPEP